MDLNDPRYTARSEIQEIRLPSNRSGIKVLMKRDDLIHGEVSGNKWRKLKYNLLHARELGHKRLITFGGAFSNHIYAVAGAGELFGFKTTGIIRGEEHLPLNPTLSFARQKGMELVYLNRSVYRQRNEQKFQNNILRDFGPGCIIPEGGTNCLALKGVEEIYDEIDIPFDYICTACGSGGTTAGLIAGAKENKVIGFPVLEGGEYLQTLISDLLAECKNKQFTNWTLNADYHFGGFAKITGELVRFMDWFEKENKIKLDPIYTGKLLFGINDLVEKSALKMDL